MRELCEVVELKAVALLVLGTRVHEVTHQQDNLRSRVSVNTMGMEMGMGSQTLRATYVCTVHDASNYVQ